MRIALYVIALLMCVTSAQAFFVSVNDTQLPYSSYHTLNLTLQDGLTADLQRVDSDGRIQIFFPQSVLFNGTNQTQVNISYNVPPFVLNESTNLTAILNVSSSDLGTWQEFNVTVEVNKTQPDFAAYEIRILSGAQLVNVTSNLLPMNGYLLYNISGFPEEKVNITCVGSVLQCPADIKIQSNGVAVARIDFYLSLGLPAGSTTHNITFTYANYTRTTNATFVIREPTLSEIHYLFTTRPECWLMAPAPNNTTRAYMTRECLEEYENYNSRTISQFLARLDALQNESAYCPVEIKTEYLVVGSVNKTFMEEYDQCKQDRNLFSTQLRDKDSILTTVQNDYAYVSHQLLDNESDAIIAAHNYRTQVEKEFAKKTSDFERKQRIKFWTTVSILTLIFVTIIVIKGNQEDSLNGGDHYG